MQQNNMTHYQYSHSPPLPSSSYNTKINRLYQQLLQSNYLNDHIYNTAENESTPATIKFVSPPSLSKDDVLLNDIDDYDDQMLRSAKYNSLFRQFDGAKNSHQITQSLPSNYSIIQIENQSHSTINLYNLSKNFERDVSFSSNNITAKLHNQNSHIYIPEDSRQSQMLLEGSANRQQPTVQQISCLESQQKMRKYRSEEYSGQTSKDPINQQQNQEMDSPLPKLLANKYIKNDISRKFSNSNNGQGETTNFKTVLNQIHVVPYKINQEVQPYVFSVPVDQNKGHSYRGKANSLNLQNSRCSFQKEDNKPNKVLYFSNHPHHTQQQKARPQYYISTHNTPADSECPKMLRAVPKSQPKPHHLSNQKTARSNSIECKTKPFLSFAKNEMHNQHEPDQRLQQSKVQRAYKNEGDQKGLLNMQNYTQSVIYDETQVNLCCGISRPQKNSNANRIIFKSKDQGKGFNFCDQMQPPSVQITNLNKLKRANCSSYKINPVKVIKSYNDNRESQSQKKGIKLVGFNSSFSKKE